MYLKETVIKEGSVSYANSDLINTQKSVAITKPINPKSECEIIVYSPTTESDITCKVFNTELSLGGGDRDALLCQLSFPKSQSITGTTVNTNIRFVHGLFNGCDAKLVFSNDTAIGGSGAFTASYRIREV